MSNFQNPKVPPTGGSHLPHVIDGTVSPKPEMPLDDSPSDTPEQQWQRSVANMAGEAISLMPFWSRTFGKNWESFEVPSDLMTLTQQAADSWVKIADKLISRDVGPAEIGFSDEIGVDGVPIDQNHPANKQIKSKLNLLGTGE
jgi:hypothetical protein